MEDEKKVHGQLVFGLDIGTRSIVGTVGYKNEDDSFVVVAQCGKEHATRAMLDGQIHDIGKVSQTIQEVKETLQKKVQQPLRQVCIAAAGRVLKTVQVHTDYELDEEQLITEEHILALQSKAIEEAYKEFLKDDSGKMKFYCVGSSVVKYYMNDYVIGNLRDQKAGKIGMDLIATFLPDEVVDGLYRAVELAGLTVVSMTLEPIAAMELAIPQQFRLLNIALVDVGAGTSDISITREGSIIAFGMIPKAGDCLTESIANYCLVDFKTAEQIKRDIGEMDAVSYEDILGLPQTIQSTEIHKLLSSQIEEMADSVGKKILELNGDKPVGAVFVVGGGGKIPGYTEALAAKIGLVKERVALRGKEVMGNIIFEDTDMERNSLLVTPIGICLDFYRESHNFIYVTFNDSTVKLYNSHEVTVMDAAIQTNYKIAGLFPKSGKELNFTVNGKKRIVRGEMGEPALIFVNDELANLHTTIKNNDVIRVIESTAGAEGKCILADLKEYKSDLTIFVNGTKVAIPRFPSVNGTVVTEDYLLQEGDEVEFLDYVTASQIREVMDLIIEENSNCYVNNKEADADTKVYENFEVQWKLAPFETKDEKKTITEELPAVAEAEKYEEKTVEVLSHTEEAVVHTITVVVNGKSILLSGKKKYVFVDVFDYITFDLSKPQGEIVTTINGRPAEYMEELFGGEILEIYWRK